MIPLVVAASACGSSTIPAPRIVGVAFSTEPGDIGYIGVDTVLVVTGENLSDDIVPDAADPDESKVSSVRISVLSSSGGTISLVEPLFLSPTRFEATLPPEISPGSYGVLLEKGGEIAGEAEFRMGYQATTLLVLTTAQEPSPGQANRVSMALALRAENGALGILKEELEVTPAFSSQEVAHTLPLQIVVPRGEIFEFQAAIHDSSAEIVTISLEDTSGRIVTEGNLNVEFIPGLPVQARLLPANVINPTDTFVDTFLRIEDQWENQCPEHETYSANFAFQTCPGASAIPDPVVVASNAGFVPVRINCPLGNQALVNFDENTSTQYDPIGAPIGFE